MNCSNCTNCYRFFAALSMTITQDGFDFIKPISHLHLYFPTIMQGLTDSRSQFGAPQDFSAKDVFCAAAKLYQAHDSTHQ